MGVYEILPNAGADKMWILLAVCAVTFALVLLVFAFGVHTSVIACKAAWKGRDYRYPLTLRLIRP